MYPAAAFEFCRQIIATTQWDLYCRLDVPTSAADRHTQYTTHIASANDILIISASASSKTGVASLLR